MIILLPAKTTSEGALLHIYPNPSFLSYHLEPFTVLSQCNFRASSFTTTLSLPQGCMALLGHTAFCLYCHAFVLIGVPTSLSCSILSKVLETSLSSMKPSLINIPYFQMDLIAPSFLLRHFNTFLMECTVLCSFIRGKVNSLKGWHKVVVTEIVGILFSQPTCSSFP